MARSRASFAIVAAAALALAMCLAAPAALAAENEGEAQQGKITINKVTSNNVTTYDAYQIFKADISDEGEATNISWADPDLGPIVEGVIKAHAGQWKAGDKYPDENGTELAADDEKIGTEKYTGTTAQDAADYIVAHVNSDTLTKTGTDPNFVYTLENGTRVTADSLANLLAAAINASPDVFANEYITAGTQTELDEGYWLFVTSPDEDTTADINKMGTSAIFQVINKAKPLVVTEKTNLPVVTKEVKEDGTVTDYEPADDGSYLKLADGSGFEGPKAEIPAYDSQDPKYEAKDTDEDGADDAYVRYKQVTKDPWGLVADANKDQEMEYRISGTLPDNYVTFDTYFYKFTDTLSAGLDLVTAGSAFAESDVVVKYYGSVADFKTDTNGTVIDSTKYIAAYDAATKKLTVTFDPSLKDDGTAAEEGDTSTDLKLVTGITKDSVVAVFYKAKLNGNSIIAGTGNDNKVDLEYSNNPNTDDHGKTNEVENKLYTFELEIEKVRKGAEDTKLENAYFVITVSDSATDGNQGKYVKTDGSLADLPNGIDLSDESTWLDTTTDPASIKTEAAGFIFKTDANGKFTAPRLDAGEYLVKEIKAPAGYNLIASDVKVKIDATYGTDAQATTLIKLAAEATGGNGDGVDKLDAGGNDTTAADYDGEGPDGIVETGTGLKGIDSLTDDESTTDTTEQGTVKTRVTDEQRLTMPITGMDGITFTYLMGGIVLAASVFGLLVRRHRMNALLDAE